jgi:hypothetical protein
MAAASFTENSSVITISSTKYTTTGGIISRECFPDGIASFDSDASHTWSQAMADQQRASSKN